ncbi:MAG: HrpE/YscL family type III secretion apparatus protein [Planctomycetota bacterium]
MFKINAAETIASSSSVIRAEDYQAFLQAKAILESARAEADSILEAAKRDALQLKEEGYQEGLAAAQSEMAEHVVASVSRSVEYLGVMESRIIQVVIKALRKIIGEIDDEELVLRVVNRALSVARDQAKIKLRVCPAETELVQSKVDELCRQYPVVRFLDVVCDSKLTPGSCILESEMGVVDASVEVQIAAVEKSLTNSIGVKLNHE